MHHFEKRSGWAMLFSFCCLLLVGCNASGHRSVHELITLRTEETVWGHKITVTPCAHSSRNTYSDTAPENSKHVLKCPNAEVVLENEMLSVNGKNYGKLAEKAAVRVENQKVFINDQETQPLEQSAAAPAAPRTVHKKVRQVSRALAAYTKGHLHRLVSN